MSWLQKKINIPGAVSYYNLDISSKFLLVGLGNPGEKYQLNFHNIGFLTLDDFVKKNTDFSKWQLKKDAKAYISEGMIGDKKIIAVKPETFMNDSGYSVNNLMSFYKLKSSEIIVIYDDIDLDFGVIRTRFGGSSAGHNGIQSIIDLIGDNFNRIKIGINNPVFPKPAKNVVLKNFTKSQQSYFSKLFNETNAIINEFTYSKAPNIVSETRHFIDLN